jgi:hypothetical protein
MNLTAGQDDTWRNDRTTRNTPHIRSERTWSFASGTLPEVEVEAPLMHRRPATYPCHEGSLEDTGTWYIVQGKPNYSRLRPFKVNHKKASTVVSAP